MLVIVVFSSGRYGVLMECDCQALCAKVCCLASYDFIVTIFGAGLLKKVSSENCERKS